VVYIDAILIFSTTFKRHLNHLQLVFSKLRDIGVRLKKKKCTFGMAKCVFLGFVVDGHGVRPNPSKISALVDLPRPRNVKEVRSFLGLASYFRRFMASFASEVDCIQQLVKKNTRFFWNEEHDRCFIKLKTLLTSSPILKLFNENLPTILSTNASGFAVGAVLEQIYEDGSIHPISYFSRKLKSA
jgi:hypothetical protein